MVFSEAILGYTGALLSLLESNPRMRTPNKIMTVPKIVSPSVAYEMPNIRANRKTSTPSTNKIGGSTLLRASVADGWG